MSATTESPTVPNGWGFKTSLRKMVFNYQRKKWKNKHVNLNDFHILNTVGRCSFGKVHIVQHKVTGKRFTMKYMNKNKIVEMKACNNVIKERSILEALNHPFLANLKYSFQDEKYLYMCTELMLGGDLGFFLTQFDNAEEEVVRFWTSQMVLAINYVHSKGFIHRDIKPDNLLIDEFGYLNLSDFNLACCHRSSDPLLTAHVGTPHYMAPELLNKSGYDKAIDWWSLGVTLYELLIGKKPFDQTPTQSTFEQIQQNELKFPTSARITNKCKSFLSGLLCKNPGERLGSGENGFQDLINHPWIKSTKWSNDLLNKEIESPFEPDLNQCNYDDMFEIENVIFDENLRQQQLKAKRKQKSMSMMTTMNESSRLSTASTVSAKSKFTMSSRNSSISPSSTMSSASEYPFDTSMLNQLPTHQELTQIEEDIVSIEIEYQTFDYHSQPKIYKYTLNQFNYNL